MPQKRAAVAIGGNSLIQDKSKPDVLHQWSAVRETCTHIAGMIENGWDVVVTHGNGPQVGFMLRRHELAAAEVYSEPLDIIVADTQGAIGYMLQQALENEFRRRRIEKRVVTLITQVLVDADDSAFQHPTKPIGGYLSDEQADGFRADGWTVVDDAGRGLRRVVASPQPLRIIELEVINALLQQGIVVIAVGGGGIPVIENHKGELRELTGTPAVIDKDRATSLLASGIDAELFLISTAVEQVALNFNQPNQQNLSRMSLTEAQGYLQEGHFAKGSMQPKVEAVLRFLENGGQHALITNPQNINRALEGKTGTWVSVT
ncbi:MAG: carbamate kinase [Chloroflexi bacterium]|nr:carbamate kinase [Chloroflexota bacterium]